MMAKDPAAILSICPQENFRQYILMFKQLYAARTGDIQRIVDSALGRAEKLRALAELFLRVVQEGE